MQKRLQKAPYIGTFKLQTFRAAVVCSHVQSHEPVHAPGSTVTCTHSLQVAVLLCVLMSSLTSWFVQLGAP